MRRATIIGTGMYAPERVVPNSEFNIMYDMDVDTFLRTNRNIYERHYMAQRQATSDLVVAAATEALEQRRHSRRSARLDYSRDRYAGLHLAIHCGSRSVQTRRKQRRDIRSQYSLRRLRHCS